MHFDKHKKTLFVTEMDQDMHALLRQVTKIGSENMLVLQTYGPEISQPYGDLMRDIILAVYQENVEDIFVVGIKGEHQNGVNMQKLQNRICDHDGIQEKLKVIDFLFKHCMPELQGGTLGEWLEGSQTVIEGIQKSVKFVRDHPLMPRQLNVYGMLLDRDSGELAEI